jgi:hypothetical protein
MENVQFNFVGPLAPIIGAIVGALITAAITYFILTKRRSLGFWVTHTEDLTSSLRRHHQQIVVSVGGQPFLNLNRATVFVKNTGNVSIGDFRFDIEIPGEHKGYLADVDVKDADLRKAIQITTDQPPPSYNPALHVNVSSFINAGEAFKIGLFFDNESVDCVVRCRIADVRAKVKWGEPLGLRDIFRTDEKIWLSLSAIVLPLVFVLAGIISTLFEKLIPWLQTLFPSKAP